MGRSARVQQQVNYAVPAKIHPSFPATVVSLMKALPVHRRICRIVGVNQWDLFPSALPHFA